MSCIDCDRCVTPLTIKSGLRDLVMQIINQQSTSIFQNDLTACELVFDHHTLVIDLLNQRAAASLVESFWRCKLCAESFGATNRPPWADGASKSSSRKINCPYCNRFTNFKRVSDPAGK